MGSILAFTLVAFLLVISPGPNGVLILKTASVHGTSAAIRNAMGLFSATFVHGALSVFGLSAILVHSAELFTVIKVLGAAYLFYMGVKAIYQSFATRQASVETSVDVSRSSRQRGFFREGFLTQLLNPKVSIFYLAAFPQFISVVDHYYVVASFMVLIHASIVFSWFVFLTLTIQKMKATRSRTNGAIGRWVQRVSGAVMVYFSSLVVSH